MTANSVDTIGVAALMAATYDTSYRVRAKLNVENASTSKNAAKKIYFQGTF